MQYHGIDEYRVEFSEAIMKSLLVSAIITLFALPAVAGELPQASPAQVSSATGTATTAGDVVATVATGEVKGIGENTFQQSVPSFSGYGGGCDREHTSTEAMLIN